ncbi:hypothetical protein [Tumebacillus algifaecis]|uniref:hypothetical protein n=1 Tax=Tumebacillus algifaecis TaxID=1214604 RepID=UPI0012FD1395|nr:hypothetical protein [Tumebacillus algifaecis]
MSGEINHLYVGESSSRKGYQVGDQIRIRGNVYVLEMIEADDKPFKVWLKRADR